MAAAEACTSLRRSLYAPHATLAALAELCGVFRREICGPNFRFSVEIAEVSTNFNAIFARETRPAPAEPLQKLQACAAKRVKHMNNFCAPFSRVARTFGTEIAQFCGRNSRDLAGIF